MKIVAEEHRRRGAQPEGLGGVERCEHTDADAANVRAVQAQLIEPEIARTLAGVFKSLSDPTRLRIISALSQREFCVGDLAAALEMEQSTISHQLRDMRAQRLVNFRREGRHVFYRLDDPHVRDLYCQGLAHTQDE
ncbi:MAG: metalloregulator ArsR/SmtB family transcription factor [Chloroflexi bacterium]|nr:metalloregulator ArsR/SmtB family transcription factor [Chloroflexota bacterium]